jgi:hypothetical protein
MTALSQPTHKLDTSAPIFAQLSEMALPCGGSVYLHVKTWKRKDWVSKTIILRYNERTKENEYSCELLTPDNNDNAYVLRVYEKFRITRKCKIIPVEIKEWY